MVLPVNIEGRNSPSWRPCVSWAGGSLDESPREGHAREIVPGQIAHPTYLVHAAAATEEMNTRAKGSKDRVLQSPGEPHTHIAAPIIRVAPEADRPSREASIVGPRAATHDIPFPFHLLMG